MKVTVNYTSVIFTGIIMRRENARKHLKKISADSFLSLMENINPCGKKLNELCRKEAQRDKSTAEPTVEAENQEHILKVEAEDHTSLTESARVIDS